MENILFRVQDTFIIIKQYDSIIDKLFPVKKLEKGPGPLQNLSAKISCSI